MIISNNIIIRIKKYIKWYLCNCVACPQHGTYEIANASNFLFFFKWWTDDICIACVQRGTLGI